MIDWGLMAAEDDLTKFTVDAMLADSAVTADGKLYLQGSGWNMINAQAFPFQVPRIGIGLVIGVPYGETNRNHTFQIKFSGDDGPLPLGRGVNPQSGQVEGVMEISGQFNLGRPPTIQPGDRQAMAVAMNFDGLVFDKPGAYSFGIWIDQTEINHLPFRVAAPPAFTIRT